MAIEIGAVVDLPKSTAFFFRLTLAILCCPGCMANARAENRVTTVVDDAQRVELRAQLPKWVENSNARGPVADDLELSHISIVLKRSPQQQTAFEQFLKNQQNPNSPDFHHWLSPVEVGERFGASSQDLAALTNWLRKKHLHVDALANSRTRLTVHGTAGQIGAAFATQIQAYFVNGQTQIAPASNPQIPIAFSALVQSINGLSTISEHGHAGAGAARFDAHAASSDQPGATFCQGSNCTDYVFPADFAQIYDINRVYQQNINGSGQTIAIVGRARVYLPDIENFQMRAGLPTKDPIIVVPPDGVDPGPAVSSGTSTPEDQLEATIDVTRAGSVAPGATVQLVVSANAQTSNGIAVAAEYLIDTNSPPAQIVSISFGACEANAGKAGVDFYDSLFSQAAAEGISVFVISGDSGAAGCDPYNAIPPSNQILSPNYICVSSYATCVGGTQFADTQNPAQYWGANGNGYLSALGYIPEGAWNEPLTSSGASQASATGGGISAYIPTPSWQVGPGVPGAQGRYTPDVSFTASAHDGYFACLASSGNSCVSDSSGSFRFEYFYGTSASTPDMAGVAALLNQQSGAAQGNLNPRLYELAAIPANAVFHDVTVASSGVNNCDVAVPSLCNNSTPGPTSLSGGLNGYLVGAGYDLATGLGSIDVASLLSNWSAQTTGINIDQHGLTGTWWNPQTSGQGLVINLYADNVAVGHGTIAAGWYTFDVPGAGGGQRWYTLQGDVYSGSPVATVGIYTAVDGNLNAAPKATGSQVGTATLSFSDCSTGSLAYSFNDGRAGSIPLSRLTSNTTCGPNGDNGNAASNYLLAGAWYDPNTSGQGFYIDISPGITTLFGSWYTFFPADYSASSPRQQWFVFQDGTFTPGTTLATNIPLQQASGGSFAVGGGVNRATVGSVSISFQSCTAMTLSYTISPNTLYAESASGTIQLARLGPAPAGCSL
jgi:pseudomonalisin